MPLHPAENRGYRELYAFARQLSDHWTALAGRFPEAEVLPRGAALARELIAELAPATAAHGLHGRPAAQGAGRSIARGSGARDRFLERNQALRFAVGDAQHLTTLLGYLAVVSAEAGNADLAELAGRWERKVKRLEPEARKAVAALAADLDRAVEPFDSSPVGRAAHGVGYVVGTAGEWFDRRAAGRSGR
jgi:hypothetical protein